MKAIVFFFVTKDDGLVGLPSGSSLDLYEDRRKRGRSLVIAGC